MDVLPYGAQLAQTAQAMQRAAELDVVGAAAMLRQAQVRVQLSAAEHTSVLS